MTEDLTPSPGRVFVGRLSPSGGLKLLTVKSVRRRKTGIPSSAILTYESIENEVRAEVSMTLPADGKMHGFRRVTVAHVATAKVLTEHVGDKVPTDAVVIVTRDRVGSEKVEL